MTSADDVAPLMEEQRWKHLAETAWAENDKLMHERLNHCLRAEAAEAESARLRVLLKDCADDLEEWVKAEYASRMHYPSEVLKMTRDMDNVNRARAALKAEGGEI